MSEHFLVTYHPLCGNGRIPEFDPPFVDGSIRREPDLELRHPSISALCRKGKFAPKLGIGDCVIYMTVKGKYPGDVEAGWRLVAALEVIRRFESHEEAASWFKANDARLPSNCMVAGNPPIPLERTRQGVDACSPLHERESEYERRARDFPVFLACQPIKLNLATPKRLDEAGLTGIFGMIPGTQGGKRIEPGQFQTMLDLMS